MVALVVPVELSLLVVATAADAVAKVLLELIPTTVRLVAVMGAVVPPALAVPMVAVVVAVGVLFLAQADRVAVVSIGM